MKIKNRCKRALAFMLVLSFLITVLPGEIHKAASSYDDAKLFYESTGQENGKHIDVYDGKVYFATQAKLAYSSSNKRYITLGFDVTLTGGGRSVSFAVKRGGSLAQVNSRTYGNYEYILYEISTEDLFRLAQATGNANASTVLGAAKIDVCMDAIMTTKLGNSDKGGITENGYGGFTSWGTIYRLKDSSDLNKMKDIFSGHTFESYKEIVDYLDNYQLSILYDAGDGASVGNGYTEKAYNAGGITVSNAIHASGSVVQDKYRVVNQFYFKSPSHFGLSKTGYHIDAGKEWKKADGSVYSSSKVYMPKNIEPAVGHGNKGVVLYANWKANSYNVIYNANGGHGSVAPSVMVYDEMKNLRANTFKRTGYYIPQGREWIDANGNIYNSSTPVSNLTSVNGGDVILFANWEPVVVSLTFDKQTGSGGTDRIFEKYNTGFYSDEACSSWISSISIPGKVGYDFIGYYAGIDSGGRKFVNADGTIAISNTFLIKNTLAYADWLAKKFNVTFDLHGGKNGTSSAIATYEQLYPEADAPERTGYSFKGYYTEKNGKGNLVYNEYMATDKKYLTVADSTVFAYWVDDISPRINLSVTNADWTNKPVSLIAEASDRGSGLKHVAIYEIKEDKSLVAVSEQDNLGGVQTKELTFENKKEGIVRYKAVATDMAGNTAESYNTVFYDTTAPTGEVVSFTINGTTYYFDFDITDINTGD